VAQWLGHRS